MARLISLEEYLLEQCGPMPSCVAFSRATASMSMAAFKRAQEQLQVDLYEWQERRDAARNMYAALVDLGEIVEPTTEDELTRIAMGNPDSDQVQAAIRVLEKRKRRQA